MERVDMYQAIGRRIRQARRAADLSQQQLAGRLGVTRETIRNWETGVRRLHIDDLARVASETKVDIADFFETSEAAKEERERKKFVAAIRRIVDEDYVKPREANRGGGHASGSRLNNKYSPRELMPV